MKKTTYLLAALIFVLGVILSGCSGSKSSTESSASTAASDVGGSESDDKKVTLSYLSWDNEQVMKPVLDGFKAKYPNITIDLQYAPPIEGYVQKLQTMLLSNSGPDLFMMAAENRTALMDGGYAMDLTDLPYMDVIAQPNKDTYSKDGKVYSLSQASWVGGFFYNKALFAKAGITQEPQTWQEFIEVCKKLKAAGITPLYEGLNDLPMSLSGLVAAINYKDNLNFDDEIFSGKKTFEQLWTKPLQMWYDGLVKNDIITKNMIGLTSDQMLNAFETEQVAMYAGGPWLIPHITKANPNIDFKMLPIPGENPGDAFYSGAANVGFSIYSKTPHKDAALKFLEYLASPEGLQAFSESTGQIITAKGYESKVHPSLEEAYKNGLMKDHFYYPIISWKKYQEALSKQLMISIQNLVVGKGSPIDVAKSVDSKLNEMDSK